MGGDGSGGECQYKGVGAERDEVDAWIMDGKKAEFECKVVGKEDDDGTI
jgi:hypothetical protein